MQVLPILHEEEARAITTRLSEALGQVGSSVSTIHLQVVPAGLLVVARVGAHEGMCVIPHGHTVEWATLAHALQDTSVLAESLEEVGR
jgi:hypothetical protein